VPFRFAGSENKRRKPSSFPTCSENISETDFSSVANRTISEHRLTEAKKISPTKHFRSPLHEEA
jgi:hypothetical protein